MRVLVWLTIILCSLVSKTQAQLTSQKEAQYMATLKAVVNYKIDDEENISKIEDLRNDKRFNQKLQKMMEKLQNTRTKNSTNKRIYNILLKAGQEIYKELD